MSVDNIDIVDREARLFTCLSAVVELLNPSTESRSQPNVLALMEFVSEEYAKARSDLLQTLNVKKGAVSCLKN